MPKRLSKRLGKHFAKQVRDPFIRKLSVEKAHTLSKKVEDWPEKLTHAHRERVFDSLGFSPHRRKMIRDAQPELEALHDLPGVRRGYVFGSFSRGKRHPSDIDVLLSHDIGERGGKSFTQAERINYSRKHPLHIQHTTQPNLEKRLKRYEGKGGAKGRKAIRIFGAAAGTAAGKSIWHEDYQKGLKALEHLK
jgi:predicted nucleotidyltransferase